MAKEELPMEVSTTDQDTDFSESGDLTGDGGVMKEVVHHGVNGWQKPEAGDDIQMHYRGTLLDGTEFDSSYSRDAPFSFKLADGKVIKGWDIVAKTMAKGEKAKVTLKPEYAYGEMGSPPKIPKNATLIFEMELLSWTSKRDVFGDGLVVKSEIASGEGWERPGKLAEVTVAVVAVAMDSDAKTDGKQLHSGETTFTMGSSQAPLAWEKVLPDMKKDAVLHLVCRPPHTSGPGVDYVPADIPCVRFELTLKSWCKIEDVLSDGTLVKKIMEEGEGWERPSEGATATVTIRYMLPDLTSKLAVPPPLGDAVVVQENLEFKVGDGIVIDGIDRVVQSMKVKESAMVSIVPNLAFETATNLLTSEFSGKGFSKSSRLLVDIVLTKLEKSKDVWSMSFEEKVDEMRVRKTRGNELFKEGRFASAKKSYDRAVAFFDSPTSELSPDLKLKVNELLVDCHLNLAACLGKMGDVQKVLTHCKKALDIQPSNVKALYRQGCAYLDLDDYYNASSSWKYALELSPGNSFVIRKLRELKDKRLQQDAADKRLFSNMFDRLSKMEKKESVVKSSHEEKDGGNGQDAEKGKESEVRGDGGAEKSGVDVEMKEEATGTAANN